MPEALARSVSHVERVLLLKKARVIGTLYAPDLATVAEYMRERFFPKNSLLLEAGEATRAIYYVVEGKVHLRRKGVDVGHAGPGSGLGELTLLGRDPDGIEARAERDTLALEMDLDGVLELFDDHFAIFHQILREIARRLVELNRNDPKLAMAFAPPPVTAPELAAPEQELDLVERIFLIRRAQPFARASINALAELCRALTEVRFEPGTTLWSSGYSSRGVYLLVRGIVDCIRPGEGGGFQVGSGVPLGILEALGEVPRWHDAVTRTPVIALSGDIENMIDVMEDNFEMAMDYMAALAGWILAIFERKALSATAMRAVHCGDEPDLASAAASLETSDSAPGNGGS